MKQNKSSNNWSRVQPSQSQQPQNLTDAYIYAVRGHSHPVATLLSQRKHRDYINSTIAVPSEIIKFREYIVNETVMAEVAPRESAIMDGVDVDDAANNNILIVDYENIYYKTKRSKIHSEGMQIERRKIIPGFETESRTLKDDITGETIIDSYRISAYLILNYAVNNDFKNVIIIFKDPNHGNIFEEDFNKIVTNGFLENEESEAPNGNTSLPFYFKERINCSNIKSAYEAGKLKCILVKCKLPKISLQCQKNTREFNTLHDLKSGDDLMIVESLTTLLLTPSNVVKVLTSDCCTIADYNQSKRRGSTNFKTLVMPFNISCKTLSSRSDTKLECLINFTNTLIEEVPSSNPTRLVSLRRIITQVDFRVKHQICLSKDFLTDNYFEPSKNDVQKNWALETNNPTTFSVWNYDNNTRVNQELKPTTYILRGYIESDIPSKSLPYVIDESGTPLLDHNELPFKDENGDILKIDNTTEPYVILNEDGSYTAVRTSGDFYRDSTGNIATITINKWDKYYTKYLKYKQKYQELKNKLNKH
jgi:hypothetical protein